MRLPINVNLYVSQILYFFSGFPPQPPTHPPLNGLNPLISCMKRPKMICPKSKQILRIKFPFDYNKFSSVSKHYIYI